MFVRGLLFLAVILLLVFIGFVFLVEIGVLFRVLSFVLFRKLGSLHLCVAVIMDSELRALIEDLGLVPLHGACCRWIPPGSNYGVVPGARTGFCKVWHMQQRFKARDRNSLMVRLYERNRRGSRYAGSECVVDLKLF